MKKRNLSWKLKSWFKENIFQLKTDLFNDWTIKRYLQSTTPAFLHLNCGERMLPTALNGDIYCGDIYVDINEELPFDNNIFDRIYMFHAIEYLDRDKLISLLQECYRIMKSGSWMRIVTPDLNKIAFLYCGQEGISCDDFNRMMKGNTEQKTFIFDEPTIKELLISIGFREVVFTEYNQSNIFTDVDPMGNDLTMKTQLCIDIMK